MSRILGVSILAIAMMVGFAPAAFAQSEEYDGPQGFEWIAPSAEPSVCDPINFGAIELGSPTGVIDVEDYSALIRFPNPDPSWTDESGEPIDSILIVFEHEGEGSIYTSNIQTQALIWYFSPECGVQDGELIEEFVFPYMDELEAAKQPAAFYYADDHQNNWWIQEVFTGAN